MIQGLLYETHNWGATVAFWQKLGYVLDFETDHHSGQLSHPDGGPWVFVAERPEGHELQSFASLAIADHEAFDAPGPFEKPFTAEHWGVMEAIVLDPDGRRLAVHAPLPAGVEAPPGHG